LAVNISLPGLSMIYPDVHCTADYSVCQVTAGESEINAASSISAVALSPRFDLTSTYFMIAGIAGVNPKIATLGSVAFARFSVQVALQYEFDAREMPANFTTGYLGMPSVSTDLAQHAEPSQPRG
jgi:purine nucleoside permease